MEKLTTTLPINVMEFAVRFAETDMAGVYHHRNAFVWFEQGRFDLLGKLMDGEMGMFAANDAPIFAPVVGTRVRFTGFAQFADVLHLSTQMKLNESTKMTFYYRLTHADSGKQVVLGMTDHVALTTDRRFLFKWPEAINTRLENFKIEHPEAFTTGEEFDAKL